MKAMDLKVGQVLAAPTYGASQLTITAIENTREGSLIIKTDDTGYFQEYTFKAMEDVRFPRLLTPPRVWADRRPKYSDLQAHDVVPFPSGWVFNSDGSVDLQEAFAVHSMIFGKGYFYVNLYSPKTRKTVRMFVPGHLWDQPIYSNGNSSDPTQPGYKWEDYNQQSAYAQQVKARKNPGTTVSGKYVDLGTQQTVTFRLTTGRGRPRLGSLPAPETPEAWDKFQLAPGEIPHPADPRKYDSDNISSTTSELKETRRNGNLRSE